MKIVFLIQDCTTIGGTERTTCCLANAMARRGHDVSLISIFHVEGKCKFHLDERVRFITLSDYNYSLDVGRLRRLMQVFIEIRHIKKCREVKESDVIIAQKFFAVQLAKTAGFAYKTWAGEHSDYAMYDETTLRIRDLIYSEMKGVVVLTRSNERNFKAHGVENVVVIPNMLPIEASERCENVGREIIAVGRLAQEKGFDTLVEVMSYIRKRIKGWHLTIYGEGYEREHLQAMIDERKLDDMVRLAGASDNIAEVYRNAAFGVMPSRIEGLPMVSLEAAAAGLPMVAFNCAEGVEEIYKEGGGLVIENQDRAALGEAIVRMTENGKLREKLSDETSAIRARYSEEAIYNKWMEILDNNGK